MARKAGGRKGPRRKAGRKRVRRIQDPNIVQWTNITVTFNRSSGEFKLTEGEDGEIGDPSEIGETVRQWIKKNKPISKPKGNILYSGAMLSIRKDKRPGAGHDPVTVDSPCP